ncbi:MAG: hypothetical protein HON68_04505 [Gammaproteobacteria bacterium]|nr:hypothetical protein [Gammaproteobacteria bacterium]MBT3719602.1 hypothetical protein [Gammaproteobacteria bacterium]MBT3844108.1 hypothetical protein [Gammaproteobacteria bacterium]MBT3893672.1 hypothetical protein [Gammaproteobacteria bacterium]MBT4300275.1 hypothetical protein [Gammaproteobacteria bacterium]
MQQIEWNDDQFSVGHQLLDAQHHQIITAINRLIERYLKQDLQEDIYKELHEMLTQFESHFAVEELLLQQKGSSLVQNQIEAHEIYNSAVMRLITKNSVEETLLYLVAWWTDHILIDDMKYKGEL